MNINKYLSIIFLIIIFIFSQNIKAENHTELTTLEDDLPAIDPFSSANTGGNNIISDNSLDEENKNILNNLRLVATILSENKKIAVFAMANGATMKFSENEAIAEQTTLTRIYEDWIFIENNEDEYQVFMNNQIIPVE
jgi:hypothetical protein